MNCLKALKDRENDSFARYKIISSLFFYSSLEIKSANTAVEKFGNLMLLPVVDKLFWKLLNYVFLPCT